MPEFAVYTTAPCALRPSRWSSSPQVDSILRSGFRDPGRGWTVIASRKFLATLPRSNVARPGETLHRALRLNVKRPQLHSTHTHL